MKKFLTILLTGALALSLSACGSKTDTDTTVSPTSSSEATQVTPEAQEVPDTVTLDTYNGAGEKAAITFPFHPERLAVMDLAALDILDTIGCGDKVIGVSKSTSIDYLQKYVTNDDLFNLGTIKEVNMEALMECEPDVIFIGGRLSNMYDELSKIAPVYMVKTDIETGVIESTLRNAQNIASLFGLQDSVANLMSNYTSRIESLKAFAKGKTSIVGMVNAGGFGLLGNDGRCSIIGNEIGFENIGIDASIDTSAHGNEASFEFVVDKNPDYIFAMDRDAAIGTEGAKLAAEVLDNELINMTSAAKNGNVIVLEHSNIWYTAEGGIKALDIMLSDLENTLLK